MVNKLARGSCPARTLSWMSGLDEVLLSTRAWIAHTYNIRPIQKLARHTEDSKHQDQPHLTELNPNHTVFLGPSICFSKLSRKIEKHSIPPVGNRTGHG